MNNRSFLDTSLVVAVISCLFASPLFAQNVTPRSQSNLNVIKVKQLLKIDNSVSDLDIFRIIRARASFLPDNSTITAVEQAELRRDLISQAKRNGWSIQLTNPELANLVARKERELHCKTLGIPEDSTDIEINQAEAKNIAEAEDIQRKYEMALVALPRNAGPSAKSQCYLDFRRKQAEFANQAAARRLGLPPSASEGQIQTAEKSLVHGLLCKEYGLDETTTDAQLRQIQNASRNADYVAIARSVFKTDDKVTIVELRKRVHELAVALGSASLSTTQPHQFFSQSLTIEQMLQASCEPKVTIQN